MAALTLLLLAGRARGGSPFRSISQILGVRINEDPQEYRQEYVFYPNYDLYYNRTTGEFLSFENGQWVSRKNPRNTTAQRVWQSRSVNINDFSSPAQHRAEMARQGYRYENNRSNWRTQNPPSRYEQTGNPWRY
jgi:hypothetical protein